MLNPATPHTHTLTQPTYPPPKLLCLLSEPAGAREGNGSICLRTWMGSYLLPPSTSTIKCEPPIHSLSTSLFSDCFL